MVVYSPFNEDVFDAAFAGALAGMGVAGRAAISTSAADYAGLIALVTRFAQEFDSRWAVHGPNTPPTKIDVQGIEVQCEAAWQGNSLPPTATQQGAFTGTCDALIVELTEASSYLASIGFFPSVVGAATTQFIGPDIYISSSTGLPTNSGLDAGHPITNAELGARLGVFNTVRRSGGDGIIFIHLLDTLETDPMVWTGDNLAPGNTVVTEGQTIVFTGSAATGTVTAVQALDRSTNKPFTVSAVNLGQQRFVGRQIQILTGTGAGSRANIARVVDANTLQILGQWVTGTSIDGSVVNGIVAGNPPDVNDTYQIVDFTQLNLGPMIVGADSDNISAPTFFPGGIGFQQLRFARGAASPLMVLPTVTNFAAQFGFADCIFEQDFNGAPQAFYLFANCCFRSSTTFAPGDFVLSTFGGICPLTIAEGGTGTATISTAAGSFGLFDGDFAGCGDGTPNTGNTTGGTFLVSGTVNFGPVSFWNSSYYVTVGVGGNPIFGVSSLLGLTNFEPIYGNNNGWPILLEGGPCLVDSGDGSNVAAILPTITQDALPALSAAQGVSPPLTADVAWVFQISHNVTDATTQDAGSRSVAFDGHAATYGLLTKNTWANMLIAVVGGAGGGFAGDKFTVLGEAFHVQPGTSVMPDSITPTSSLSFIPQFV